MGVKIEGDVILEVQSLWDLSIYLQNIKDNQVSIVAQGPHISFTISNQVLKK